MHHHHLLSIKELEENRSQSLKNMFKPTIMLNAGTVLEALAQGYVNIVLHGHEHFRMYARYGTLYGQQSDAIVLGAGSITGNHSTKGCDVGRASFNSIELLADRSVQVPEIVNTINEGRHEWCAANPPIQILDGRAIRRARFCRRTKPISQPTSKLMTCVEFQADRTVDTTVSLTDWVLSRGRWATVTSNNSGIPSAADVTFEWLQGPPTEFTSKQFVVDTSQMHTYVLDVQLPRDAPNFARRITARYKWLGGAVLTKGDLDYFDPVAHGEFRNRGQEFWFVRGRKSELVSRSLLVRLPHPFAPKPQQVEVHYREPEGVFKPFPELTASVQHHSLGVFSLEIPYPRPGYGYALAWPVRDDPPVGVAVERFRRIASNEEAARRLLEAFAGVLTRSSVAGAVTLGLYIPKDSTSLRRTAEVRRGLDHAKGEVPPNLSLRNGNTLTRHAWWGQTQYALPGAGDSGFAPGELAIIMIPIRQFGNESEVTYGLLRVGVYTDGRLNDRSFIESLKKRDEREVFADGIPMVLNRVAELDENKP